MYIIAEGEAVIIVSSPDAPDRELVRRYAGQVFGEFVMVSDAPRAASVRAVTDLKACVCSLRKHRGKIFMCAYAAATGY